MIDGLGYDQARKQIYFAEMEYLGALSMRDPDRSDVIVRLPTGFRDKTGMFALELNRHCLGAPHCLDKTYDPRMYELKPLPALIKLPEST